MSNYILTYEKMGNGKYISHLDLLRTLQRAFRRGGIPLKFSQGFNPHPLISFALPLAVGITSSCEMMEIQLREEMDKNEIMKKINESLPNTLRVTKIRRGIKEFSKIGRAVYEVIPENLPNENILIEFMSLENIYMDKRTKKGIKQVNIRKDIFDICLEDDKILMELAAGNTNNLKPMLVKEAFDTFTDFTLGFCKYHRVKILDSNGKPL